MSGEQIWDSLVTLNFPDLDTRINSRTPEDGFDRFVRFSQMSAEDIFEEVMERYNSKKANRNDGYGGKTIRTHKSKSVRSRQPGMQIQVLPPRMKRVRQWHSAVMAVKISF